MPLLELSTQVSSRELVTCFGRLKDGKHGRRRGRRHSKAPTDESDDDGRNLTTVLAEGGEKVVKGVAKCVV